MKQWAIQKNSLGGPLEHPKKHLFRLFPHPRPICKSRQNKYARLFCLLQHCLVFYLLWYVHWNAMETRCSQTPNLGHIGRRQCKIDLSVRVNFSHSRCRTTKWISTCPIISKTTRYLARRSTYDTKI